MAEPNLIELDDAVSRIKQACESGEKDSPSPFFFMVGAGISHPSVPLARDVIAHCKEMARTYHRTSDPGKTNTLDQYSHWFQTAYAEPDQRQRYLRRLIEGTPITHANFRLAHLLLDSTISNLVVTTNFDDFLSKALTLFGQPHIVCDHPSTVGRINHTRPMVQIVHLHGSYWFYDCCNLRGELEDRARQSRQTSSTMASLLDQILWERSPLVIGYSGWEGDVFMEALRQDNQETAQKVLSPAESKLEKVRDALRRADYREAIQKAQQIEVEKLSAKELDELADGMSSAAHGLLDNSEEEMAAYDLLVRIRDFQSGDADKSSTVKSEVAAALVNKGITFSALNRTEEAIASYDEVIKRYPGATDLALRKQLAKALFNKGCELGILKQYEEAIATCDQLVRQFGEDQDLSQKERVAKALFNTGTFLHVLDRKAEAIEAYEELRKRYGEASELPLQVQVAKTLVNESASLGASNRYEEAITLYDELVRRYGAISDLALRQQVAMALVGKGVGLSNLKRPEEEIAVYDEVVSRYGEAAESELQLMVAKALYYKSLTLTSLKRTEEQIAVDEEIIRRYDKATEPDLQSFVEKARRRLPTEQTVGSKPPIQS